MPTWTAEIEVDEPLARRLIGRFPLEIRSLRPLSEGWDYAIWNLNDEWAFRFPRRQIALPGVRREIDVLPRLAPLLPLAVPSAVYVGAPSDDFPWAYFGSRLLPGRELAGISLREEERLELGLQVADFLRALHSVELDVDLPPDSNRRADMAARVPRTREQLDELRRHAIWNPPPSVDALLDDAERLPPSTSAEVVAHGDLHVRQLLVAGGRLTGVLDWVDLCRSDPAIDLLMYWSFLEGDGRRAFLDHYGPVTEEQLLRARVVALSVGAALAHYGHAEGHAAVAREALAGLERTVS